MKVAIVGIQGLPNNYGGFETLSEYLVKHLAGEIDFTVYCSNEVEKQPNAEYLGAKLKYVNISSHGAKGIIYDSLCCDPHSWLWSGFCYSVPAEENKEQNHS